MENNQTNEKLLAEIERLKKELKKKKKYGLVWEDKPEDVVEMCKEKLPVLKEVKSKEIITDKNKPVNLLIEGDNYHALSVLNYTHKGKIDVIYIDPPYNTGNQSWKYNNQYVEKDDAYLHSKWLSFMSKRLRLAKSLLKDDGVIIVTIDDYEVHVLGLLLGEIFGEDNRISTLIIESNPRGRTSDAFFATSHEYYLYYAKNSALVNFFNPLLTEEQENAFKLEDDISRYRLLPLRKSGAASRKKDRRKQFYPIYIREGDLSLSLQKFKEKYVEFWPIDETGEERVWKVGVKTCGELIESGDIVVSKNRKDKFTLSQKDRIKLGRKPKTLWIDPKYDASAHGTILISSILGKSNVFDYPKSLHAVIDSLAVLLREKRDAIVLDFFAGSGTTGHAIMQMNQNDDGRRKFILCTNNENGICEDVCYPRIKNVVNGYKNKNNKLITGLGGNLKYFKTDFVDYKESTDKNKIKLTKEAVEMLCVKEGTFESVLDNGDFKIFKSQDHYAGIIFDQLAINDFKKAIKNIKGKISVYIFSLGDDSFEDEFEDIKQKVKLSPIPEAILKVYRRIYK